MINVLLDGAIYGIQGRGGINRYFDECIPRIARNNEDMKFLYRLPCRPLSWPLGGPRIQAISDDWLRRTSLPNAVRRRLLRKRTEMFHPNIFHSTYYTMPPPLCFRNCLKSVVTVHDFIDENCFGGISGNPEGFVGQKRRVIEEADAVIAVSQQTRRDILKYTDTDESRITVITHGVGDAFAVGEVTHQAVDQFRKSLRIDAPYWLYVGHRHLYKNFALLLRAWAELSRSGVETYLVAVGRDYNLEPWQVDYLIQNRLETRIRIVTRVPDTTLAAAYRGSAALVCTSLSEGFGIPLIEARACKCPLLLSDIPVFREVAGDAALYFDPHSETELAARMRTVLDEQTRARLIECGTQPATPAPSWEKSARLLADLYRSLCG